MSAEFLGTDNPNTANQLWSQWTFAVQADVGKLPSQKDVLYNARVFFGKLFGSAGRVRVVRYGPLYRIIVQAEGPAANEPNYRQAAKRQFIGDFMFAGFGCSAKLTEFEVGILAGDAGVGRPADQLLVMPHLNLRGQFTDDEWASLLASQRGG